MMPIGEGIVAINVFVMGVAIMAGCGDRVAIGWIRLHEVTDLAVLDSSIGPGQGTGDVLDQPPLGITA